MDPSEVVLRFLQSIGRQSEAEFYLSAFRAQARERFAVLAIDGPVAAHALEAIVLDLRFLASLHLYPTVLLGAIESAGAERDAENLGNRLHAADVAAEVLRLRAPSSSNRAEELGEERPTAAPPRDDERDEAAQPVRALRLTEPPAGKPDSADTTPSVLSGVSAAVRRGAVPIVALDAGAEASFGKRLRGVGELVEGLAAQKLILVRLQGGIERVPLINLTTDANRLLSSTQLAAPDRALLEEIRLLLQTPTLAQLTVSVTSPFDLLRELFTVKGAGTLIRRGSIIERHHGYEGLDRARLGTLIESSFERALSPEMFVRPVGGLYLEQRYRGVAIVESTPLGGYLTKFAVERQAQGEGIGRDLWQATVAQWPVLFWRARASNPVVAWYAQQCDGFARLTDWHVFWRGVPPAQIPAVIAHTLAAPVDLS
jgi:acetylglutamate kinase